MIRICLDLFAELLPVGVHNAVSAYENRRNELVNYEVSNLREMTQLLNRYTRETSRSVVNILINRSYVHSVLASLNLPAAIEDTSGTEIPQSLLEKATYVRDAGGIRALEASMKELPDLLQRNKELLDEVNPLRVCRCACFVDTYYVFYLQSERMLQEERESDNQLREQFKERWKRIPSARLTEQFTVNLQKYREIINNAVAADKVNAERRPFSSFLLNGPLRTGGPRKIREPQGRNGNFKLG